jgi:hypothetical protein
MGYQFNVHDSDSKALADIRELLYIIANAQLAPHEGAVSAVKQRLVAFKQGMEFVAEVDQDRGGAGTEN